MLQSLLVRCLVLLKWLAIVIIVLIVMVTLFIKLAPTFGGKPDAVSQERINNSPNFDGKVFKNLIPTQAATMQVDNISDNKDDVQSGGLLTNFLFPPAGKNPKVVETVALNLHEQPLKDGEFTWLGHSSVLFKTAGKLIITDPVFHAAAPVSFAVLPFAMTHTPQIEELPYIDAVLISHDHYDHLDHKAVQKLDKKVGHFYVPLGIKAHLQRWGVADAKITELDWYEQSKLADIDIVFTPTRHFSGRGISNHRTTLWGSWVVQSPELSVYFSGDGGYSPEFAKIGEKFTGFDIAFIEDGAYNVRWQDVHMLPEQSAQAGIDVNAKVVLPIHWGKFDLSTHEWREPVRRIKAAMSKHNDSVTAAEQIQLATPKIGQRFALDDVPVDTWWEEAP